jgi:hypothetical protein
LEHELEPNDDRRRALAEEAREAAQRTFLEYGFPGWLQDAFPIRRSGFFLTRAMWGRVSGIFDEIVEGLRKKEEKGRDFDTLMANLLCAAFNDSGSSALKVSMEGRGFLPDLVREMHRRGIIEMKTGFKNRENDFGRLTRVWLKKEWIDGMWGPGLGALEDLVDWAPPELVQLRERLSEEDRKKGKKPRPIPYTETAFTHQLRRTLRIINQANRKHRVQFPDRSKQRTSLLVTDLFAVFHNATWREGGRLYTNGWFGYQRLSEKERATILIDGESVVELDYSGLHPRLLYAKEGIPYDGDPYKAVSDDDELRDVLKIILLAVLNSETETMAERVGNHMRHLNPSVHKLLIQKKLSVRQILESFKDAHEPIGKHFFSGAGLKVMRQDSMIALHILTHFAKREICCLAIHDSFITKKRHEEELRQVMGETYRRHTKRFDEKYKKGFDCPIK